MKTLTNKSGFTLIEIIVVLIIVGILASVALPNLFSNVAKSRAEEALGNIASFRPEVEGCIFKQGGVSDNACNSANLGLPTQSANFTYTLTAPATVNDTGYTIVAIGIGALSSSDQITMNRVAASWPNVSTSISCVAGGKLQGAC